MFTESRKQESRRPFFVKLAFFMTGLLLLAAVFSGPFATEGSGDSGERARQTVYSGPFSGGKGTGVGLFRRAGSVRVQVYGGCTNVVSPKIPVRNRKLDSRKRFKAFGDRVDLRIRGRFSKNQLVFFGRLKMTWGGFDCTGYGKSSFPKFKARKEKIRQASFQSFG